MTGEVFDVLRAHSILGRLMTEGDPIRDAFDRGLGRARPSAAAPPGRLLHDLFSARTLGLMAEMPSRRGSASYLSGLLIGAEIISAAGRDRCPRGRDPGQRHAGAALRPGSGKCRHRRQIGDPDAAAYGLWAVAASAGLIAELDHG